MLAEPGWDRGSTAGPRPAGPLVMRRRKRRSDRPLFGILLLAIGVVWLLNVTLVNLTGQTILSVLLMLLGLGMVFTGRRGGKGWPLLLGLVLTGVLVGNSTSLNLNLPFAAGVGDRTYRPTSGSDVRARYQLGAGNLNLDLSQLPKDTASKSITVSEGFGNVVITVPANAGVDVTAHVGVGRLFLFDHPQQHGVGLDDTYRSPDFQAAKPQLTFIVKDQGGSVTVKTPGHTVPQCAAQPVTCARPTQPPLPMPPSTPTMPGTPQ